jgi:hypothetical protein
VATEIAWTPAEPNCLACAAPECQIDPPFVGDQSNQSWPSERDHGVRNQRLSQRGHPVQDMHVERLNMLNRLGLAHLSGHLLSGSDDAHALVSSA